jgi:hypothetical protein
MGGVGGDNPKKNYYLCKSKKIFKDRQKNVRI